MLKKYHCVDKFMIRVPAFPVNALKKISDFGADDSTKNFLNTLGNYEDYFLQSLCFSGHGVEGRENLAFQEVNLKRTKLIDLIRKFSDYWIPYYKLTRIICRIFV